jgi:ribosomal protein L11 methyltransferase
VANHVHSTIAYLVLNSNRYFKLRWPYALRNKENKLFEPGFELDIGGNVRIISSEYDGTFTFADDNNKEGENVIKLNNIGSGWGSGSHPTTFLCLEFLREKLSPGMKFLDYGTGSGILSIYAAKLGATKCIGVDVDEAALASAAANCKLNSVDNIVDIIHTKEVYVGDTTFPMCDITVANILAGALTRLVGPICGYTKPGSYLCLSGIRPWELDGVKRFRAHMK